MNPETFAFTLQELEPELPDLVGRDVWPTLIPAFESHMAQLKNPEEVRRLQAMAAMINLLAPYTAARQRLQIALGQLDLYQTVLSQLSDLATQAHVDKAVVEQLKSAAKLQSMDERSRLIIGKGPGKKAQSIKWQNFEFDFGESTEMAAGILAACSDIFNKTSGNHWLMVAGVLLIIRGLQKAVTVEIDVQDSSVFWGLIETGRWETIVELPAITRYTNEERAKVFLDPLSEKQVRHSLHKLEQLQAIERRERPDGRETWRVIEKYKLIQP